MKLLSHSQLGRFLQPLLLSLPCVLLCASLASAQEESGDPKPRIREIRIDVGTVYPDEDADESFTARTANRFHIRTREPVIRTELLFKEGEVLDTELLAASERALRRLKFLNKAEVLVVPVDDQTVDIEVRTQDAWSLVPGLNVKGGGGLATVSTHLMELNLLGSGKKTFAEAIYENDVGTTWKFGYQDYQIAGSQWVGGATYKTGPLVKALFAPASRPFYSIDSKWAFGSSFYMADQTVRLFEDGEESSRFSNDRLMANAFVRRAFGERYHKYKITLKLSYDEADYSTLGAETTTPPPPDIANLTPSVGISKESVSWVKHTYIDKMGMKEDDWLGLRSGATGGYGIPLKEGFELWDVRGSVSWHADFAYDQLLLISAVVSSEVERNTILVGTAKYYKKFSGHTAALRLKTKFGYELDSGKQFQLGADSGLRGYPARQFTGENLVLANLEDRQFWGKTKWGPEIAIGTVLFVDSGDVWNDDEKLDMNWAAGFGLRLGFTRMPHEPITRVDFGWSIPDGNFALTVGLEQQF
jgi:hypothetical protein